MDINIIDNSGLVADELHDACLRALEKCGLTGEGYAKRLAPVDTGRLRSDISHAVDSGDLSVDIGTAVEYAPYVELGTGKYVSGGRPTPWVYKDEHGHWHKTNGQKPQPFIKPAVADHVQTYKAIIEDELNG